MIDDNYGGCDDECMTTTMTATLYEDDIRRRNHFNNYDSYDYLYSFIWACMIIRNSVHWHEAGTKPEISKGEGVDC